MSNGKTPGRLAWDAYNKALGANETSDSGWAMAARPVWEAVAHAAAQAERKAVVDWLLLLAGEGVTDGQKVAAYFSLQVRNGVHHEDLAKR